MDYIQSICNFIVLTASVVSALLLLLNTAGKPLIFFKKKRDTEVEEIVKDRVLEEAPDVLRPLEEKIRKIYEINKEQTEMIKNIDTSTKDILRQRIMNIYNTYKDSQKMPLHVKEELDELYKDYKNQKGNTYIDKYYARMGKFEVY